MREAAPVSRSAAIVAATSARGIRPRVHRRADVHASGAGIVREPARSHDGPVEVALAHRGIRFALGSRVELEDVVGLGIEVVGADRGDDDEPRHAGRLGGVGEQDRGIAVDGELALGRAARAGAGGEHRGIRVLQHLAELVDGGVLEVEHDGDRARGVDVGAMVGIADDGDGFVPGLREESFEDEGDLAVTSGDDDAHRTSQRGRPRQRKGSTRPASEGGASVEA